MQYFQRIVIAIVITIVFLDGCRPIISETSSSKSKNKTLILVPGFKASLLAREDGEVVWITGKEAIFGSTSLALANKSIGIDNISFHDTAILRKINLIPGLFSHDVYDSFLTRFTTDFPDYKVIEFHYDWRQDNIKAVKTLSLLVEQERKNSSNSITLVGHSMGGLIVSYYLRYGDQDFEDAVETWQGAKNVSRAIIAGAPYLGAYKIFHDMQSGNTTVLNSTLLDQEALSSFPSSYQLLPKFLGGAVESNVIDIFDINMWNSQQWGLFKNKDALSKELIESRLEFVARNLNRSKRFSALLNSPLVTQESEDISIKLLSVVGIGRETAAKMKWNQEKKQINIEETTIEDGDDTVTALSAKLPEAYSQFLNSNVMEVPTGHETLVSDEKLYQNLKEFLDG